MIWEQYSILTAAGCKVSVHKVAAHAVEKGIVQDPFLTAGNELADHFAGTGAAIHSVEDLQPLVDHVDVRARLILHRLMALSELFLVKAKKAEKEPPRPKMPRLDVRIEALGHAPSTVGKWKVCNLCGIRWMKHHRATIIAQGECPGASPWTNMPNNCLKPWRLPMASKCVYMGKVIHPSHSISYYRGVVYCNRCGYYSTGKRSMHLSTGCGMSVRPSQVVIRDSLREGRCPSQIGRWPRADEPQAPDEIRPWVVSDWG